MYRYKKKSDSSKTGKLFEWFYWSQEFGMFQILNLDIVRGSVKEQIKIRFVLKTPDPLSLNLDWWMAYCVCPSSVRNFRFLAVWAMATCSWHMPVARATIFIDLLPTPEYPFWQTSLFPTCQGIQYVANQLWGQWMYRCLSECQGGQRTPSSPGQISIWIVFTLRHICPVFLVYWHHHQSPILPERPHSLLRSPKCRSSP